MIKRRYFLLIICVILLLLCFTGCETKESKSTPNTPNTQPPSIMVNDILYYYTGEKVSIEIDESKFLGRVSSVVRLSQMPSENGQTNLPYMDAPYAKYKDGIVLLMDDEWRFFETRTE